MSVIAKLNHLRIAPRKVRLVADLIRGKKVEEAKNILNFTIKRAAKPINKLLKSALDNAKNTFQLESSNLYIQKITVDEGPKYKRWRARARGQSFRINKRTSHVIIVLEEIKKRQKKIKKPKKVLPKNKEQIEKMKKIPKIDKYKTRPQKEILKPKIEKGIRRVFRRKSFG